MRSRKISIRLEIFMIDIAIVGGGPSGNRAAMHLSREMDVTVFEEHASVGAPVQCAGLISPRAVCERTRDSVRNEIRRFVLHSPGGRELSLHSRDVRGVVIDREAYDRALSEAAEKNGASVRLSCRVSDVKPADDCVKLLLKGEKGREEISARIVVAADGPQSAVRPLVTEKPFDITYRGAQYVVKSDSQEDQVEMWIGRKIAPGFFAWKIPAGEEVRIGLCTCGKTPPMKLLDKLMRSKFGEVKIIRKQAGLIPIGPIGRLSEGRIALLGDAGGQTKPVTGGGIFLGKRAAEILADCLLSFGNTMSALRKYELSYTDQFEREISRAMLIRRILNDLPDKKIDRAVELLSSPDIVEILEDSGDIDYPGSISAAILRKAPRLIQFAPSLLKHLLVH